MLDHFAVHVGYVESAVRPIAELDWAEPDVCRGNELMLIVDTIPFEGHAVGAY